MRTQWKYILGEDGKTPIAEHDLFKWADWFEGSHEQRKIKRTEVGDSVISTIFLGLDHNYGDGAPLLFETMIFGGPHDGEMDRYSTYEEAIIGHNNMVSIASTQLPHTDENS